jgi:hypothetical protein
MKAEREEGNCEDKGKRKQQHEDWTVDRGRR